VNIFNPGPVRTRMRATAMPGEDPMTLDVPKTSPRKSSIELCQDRHALQLSRQELPELTPPA